MAEMVEHCFLTEDFTVERTDFSDVILFFVILGKRPLRWKGKKSRPEGNSSVPEIRN